MPHEEKASGEAAALEGRRRLGGAYLIALARIEPDPAQPRREIDTQAQNELRLSIEQLGVMQPIAVRYLGGENVYRIISGERRFQAAKEAGLTEIPCWVQTPKEGEILLRQIVENWQRRDLQPFELADALAELRDTNGYSQSDLARVTGKPKSEISKLLALLTLSPAAQKVARAESGELSKRHLYAITQAEPARHAEIVEKVKEEKLTAIETEREVQKERGTPKVDRRRGAPLTLRRFVTSHATVSFTFRKKLVAVADILKALDDVREQTERSEDA